MKIFKSIITVILLAVAFNSCEDEVISYAFQEISAPQEVKAHFDITNDDSGSVTITPSGEGVSVFKLYFGDTDNEEPIEVSPGSTVEHVYAEGEFLVKVIGVGSTNLTSEYSKDIKISFRAPENLKLNVDQSPINPAMVTVSASADFATLFDIYFGDEDNEEATIIMPDENTIKTYETPGDYIIKVVARGAGVATAEDTFDIKVTDATDPVNLPIDFESFSVNYAFESFGDAFTEVTENPYKTGINNSDRVGQFTKVEGAQFWAGSFLQLENPIDFSDNKLFKVKVYSPKSGIVVRLKVENADNGDIFHEVDAVNTVANDWEELSFDFSEIDTNNEYQKVVIFFEFEDGVLGDGSVYLFDDIALTSALTCDAEMDENIDPASGDINWTFMTNDFDHSFEPFGDIASSIVTNPVQNDLNTSCNVQSYIKTAGCQTWSGVGKALDNAIDLTTSPNKVFSLKVLAETHVTDVTLQLEFEPYPNTSPLVALTQSVTQVGVWEELIFDFSEHSDKTFKSIIIYFDRDQPCDEAIYYFDDLKQINGAANETLQFPLDFESSSLTYTWTGFGDANYGPIPAGIITNPDASGINMSTNVVEINKTAGAQSWAGASMDLDGSVDFSNGTTIKMKVWSPRVGTPILFKMEDSTSPPDGNGNPTIVVEVMVNSTVANAWEELSFDLTTFGAFSTSSSYDRIIIFPDFDSSGNDEFFYFDDIILTN